MHNTYTYIHARAYRHT